MSCPQQQEVWSEVRSVYIPTEQLCSPGDNAALKNNCMLTQCSITMCLNS